MSKLPNQIVVLASGSGTTFEYLAKTLAEPNVKIMSLVCSRPGIRAIDRAKSLKIPVEIAQTDDDLTRILMGLNPDLIVLAGYLRKLPPNLVKSFPEKIINVHPSLLPKYGGHGMYGRKVHEAVKAGNESESGATVHFVDDEYDSGKIILQMKVQIDPSDSAQEIEEKVRNIEKQLLAKSIRQLLSK